MHISAKTKKDEKIKDKRQIINKTLEPYTKKQPQNLELSGIIPTFAFTFFYHHSPAVKPTFEVVFIRFNIRLLSPRGL